MEFDVLSTAVGFLLGSFTGAAGTYLADKYTEQRRDNKMENSAKKTWRDISAKFPIIIEEMRMDLSKPELAHVREFFVKSSRTSVHSDTLALEYHTDIHADLLSAVVHLEEAGYITDITPGNCPKYRMSLGFIERVKSGK